MSDFKIIIGAELSSQDMTNMKSKIKDLEKDKLTLKLDVDSLSNQATSAGQNVTKNFNNAIDFKKTLNQIKEVSNALKNLKIDDSLTKKLDKLSASLKTINVNSMMETDPNYKKAMEEYIDAETRLLQAKTNTANLKVDNQQAIDSLQREKQATTELRTEIERLNQDKLLSSLDEEQININLDTEKLTSQINTLKNNIDTFLNEHNNLSNETVENINNIKASLDNVDSSKGLSTVKAKFEELKSEAKNTGEILNTSLSFESVKSKALNHIDELINKNKQLSNSYVEQLQSIKQNIQNSTNDKTLSAYTKQLSALEKELQQTGQLSKTWASQFSEITNVFKSYLSTSALVMTAINGLKTSFNEILSLDNAMVELKKVCDSTNESFEDFYYKSNDMAKSLGQTTEAIIEQVSAWSQMGYSLSEATELAETSSIFATISPEMTTDEAQEGLISVIKAYGIEAEDALDEVASKVNLVGKILPLTYYIG